MGLFRKSRIPSNYAAGNSTVRAHRPDYWLLLIVLGLAGIGLIVVYSISPALSASQKVSGGHFVGKQLIAIALGALAFWFFAKTPGSTIRKMRYVFLAAAILGALAVQIFGEVVNGATRWLQFGGISFQPVELIKLALIIYLADLLASKTSSTGEQDWQPFYKQLLIILGLVGFVVAYLQSDLGSAAVIAMVVLAMCFLAGVNFKKLAGIGLIVVVAASLAILSSPYRRARVANFFNPGQECQTAGYQSCQALIAVGSGGIFGLGLGNSIQAYGYVPQAADDSIFAILAEKFGFVGSFVLLTSYGIFFFRLKKVAGSANNSFDRLVTVGVLTWFSSQALINIGSMIGLLPLKGITLPFVSYGGTSLVFAMAATGIVFRMSKYTEYEAIRSAKAKGVGYGIGAALRRGDRRPYYAPVGRR